MLESVVVIAGLSALCPHGVATAENVVIALIRIHPDAVFAVIGTKEEPLGIAVNGIALLFPFDSIVLHEVATGCHLEPGSWYSSEPQLSAYTLSSPKEGLTVIIQL